MDCMDNPPREISVPRFPIILTPIPVQMNRPNDLPIPPCSSSMDLLQERFRQLQRAREMREKREHVVRLLSGEGGRRQACLFPPPPPHRQLFVPAATPQHHSRQLQKHSSMFDERRAPNCNIEDSSSDHVDTSLHL